MDIKSLQIFIDLAEDLHFANTSKKHHVSTSTLTRLVQRLEQEAGTALFERNNRHVGLTSAGQHYLEFARNTLLGWQQFKQVVGIAADNLTGAVNLYCSVTASHSLLDNILSDLRREQPDIELKLHTGDQALSLDRLKQGQEDLVIAAKPSKLDSQVDFKRLTRSELVLIGPSNSCAVRDQLNSMNAALEWSALPWILPEQGLTRSRVDQWFRKQGFKPTIYAQVMGHEAIVSMVALGCGVGLVPRLVLTNSPVFDSISVLAVGSETAGTAEQALPLLTDIEIGLCAMKRRMHEPLIAAVWRSIVEK